MHGKYLPLVFMSWFFTHFTVSFDEVGSHCLKDGFLFPHYLSVICMSNTFSQFMASASPNSFSGVFWWSNVLDFKVVQWPISCFLASTFCVSCNTLLSSKVVKLFYIFSHKFKCFAFHVCLLIHLKLISVYEMKSRSTLFSIWIINFPGTI